MGMLLHDLIAEEQGDIREKEDVYIILCEELTSITLCIHLIPLQVRQALSSDAKKDGIQDTPDAMFAYMVERVRNNLHVILCMSPVGEPFRYVCR